MKYNLRTNYEDGGSIPAHRSLGHSALLAELAERLDDHEVYGNVVSWTISPADGQSVGSASITTLTVYGRSETVTTVHANEQAAVDALRANFDPENEYEGKENWMQMLMDDQALIVNIENHPLEGI